MQKFEIGGYFGMEEGPLEEYYPDLLKLNLGRTAFIYLVKKLGCKKLLLPYFLCDSVTSMCETEGIDVSFYHVDKNLTPLVDAPLEDGAWLGLISHYGQLTDDKILAYKAKYDRIIVDHTQAFFQKPLPGIPTIYSMRKYFGLPDGAYISADIDASDLEMYPEDRSAHRMEHILGRLEDGGAAHYETRLKTDDSFHTESIKRMSPLTRNMLKQIDYAKAKSRREDNYDYLDSVLGPTNALNFVKPEGPFMYPYYHKDAQNIRKELAKEGVFVAAYWGNVISDMPEDSVEYDFAAHILPLACDQRYDRNDLEKMIKILKDKNVF